MGILLLFKGADWLIEGACVIATHFGISLMVVGLTVVAYGTSAPEFFVASAAALDGKGGIVIGSVLGSNISNMLMVLGIASFIHPFFLEQFRTKLKYNIIFCVSISMLLIPLWWKRGENMVEMTRLAGGILLLFFVFYQYILFRKQDGDVPLKSIGTMPLPRAMIILVIGIAALAIGSEFFLKGAMDVVSLLAQKMDLIRAERIVSLTLVAIGTSLPELVTTIVAAFKKKASMAVGNAVGSNIFNILWVLGGATVIRPIAFHDKFYFELGGAILAPLLVGAIILIPKPARLSRAGGAVLFVSYIFYLFFIFLY